MKFRALLCLFLILIITGCSYDCECCGKCKEVFPTEIAATAEPVTEPVTKIENNAGDEFDILEIYVFDIGKADAILIMTENYKVMIDAGENRHGLELVNALYDKNISEIDYLILTHFHKDHIGGAHVIIDYLDVKEVIVANYSKESRHVERLVSAVNNAGLESIVLKDTLRFMLDNAEFILYPAQSEYHHYAADNNIDEEDDDYDEDNGEEEDENEETDVTNENNFSIVISVSHGSNSFLFTGDAKARRLREILAESEIINTDFNFLKVPHHGRHNRRSVEFINVIRPAYAVITCSVDNPPDRRVTAALENIRAEIFLTQDGGVYAKSDGEKLIVEHRSFN